MRYLTLALVAFSGIVTTDVAAHGPGCRNSDYGAPIKCDYNYLWENFSPTQCYYAPKPGLPCGGCRLGCGKLLGNLCGACQGYGANDCCNDNCCPSPSPNIGWDGWGHGCGGAGLGGFRGRSLSSWHVLGGAGSRLTGSGCCDADCHGSRCAGDCWLGSLMERLRNCGSTCAMSRGSSHSCGLVSSRRSFYPAGNLDVSFGCANGCGTDVLNGDVRADLLPGDVSRAESPRNLPFEDTVPLPPVGPTTGAGATLKLDHFSLKR